MYLSPLKGYKCAYAVSGGKYTCSSYGRKIFLRFSPIVAIKLLRRQFLRCHNRALMFNSNRGVLVHTACGVPFCCGPDGSDGRGY
ncbi:membrane protein insertion efficiency factor YidD [Candidatus Woesearchaeota archaeon]|nr:membrane protein insertion efficiency factor YidD [Candidatus Woesearchaeota archaeon]